MHSAIQLYEEIVRLKSVPSKGGGKLPPPFAPLRPARSTRDELSRVDHIQRVLGMVSAGYRCHRECRPAVIDRKLARATCKSGLQVAEGLTIDKFVAPFAKTPAIATVAKNATVGRAWGPRSVVKQDLTTRTGRNRQGLLERWMQRGFS